MTTSDLIKKTNLLMEQIKSLRRNGLSDAEIGRQYGCSKQYVGQVAGPRHTSADVAAARDEKEQRLQTAIATAQQAIFINGEDRETVRVRLGLSKKALADHLGMRHVYLESLGLKHCFDCMKFLPTADFAPTARICKECARKRTRAYRKRLAEIDNQGE